MIRAVLLVAALIGTAPASAATWTVDPAASKLGFSGSQTGQPFSGTFKTWTGTIDYDPDHPAAAHILVTVDTASASSGDTQRDEALPGDDWFDVTKFPKATFEATGFTPKGGTRFETTGKLTLRGISKDVTLPFDLMIDGDKAHATGTATLVRTAFGVGQGAWATDEYVAFDVGVTLDVTAHRAP